MEQEKSQTNPAFNLIYCAKVLHFNRIVKQNAISLTQSLQLLASANKPRQHHSASKTLFEQILLGEVNGIFFKQMIFGEREV